MGDKSGSRVDCILSAREHSCESSVLMASKHNSYFVSERILAGLVALLALLSGGTTVADDAHSVWESVRAPAPGVRDFESVSGDLTKRLVLVSPAYVDALYNYEIAVAGAVTTFKNTAEGIRVDLETAEKLAGELLVRLKIQGDTIRQRSDMNVSSPKLDGMEKGQVVVLKGVEEFVRKRAGEEAIRYVLKRLRASLCMSYGNQLLRRTCEVLAPSDSALPLVAPIEMMRGALEQDLQTLPGNLITLVEAEKLVSGPAKNYLLCGLGFGIFASSMRLEGAYDVLRQAHLAGQTAGCRALIRTNGAALTENQRNHALFLEAFEALTHRFAQYGPIMPAVIKDIINRAIPDPEEGAVALVKRTMREYQVRLRQLDLSEQTFSPPLTGVWVEKRRTLNELNHNLEERMIAASKEFSAALLLARGGLTKVVEGLLTTARARFSPYADFFTRLHNLFHDSGEEGASARAEVVVDIVVDALVLQLRQSLDVTEGAVTNTAREDIEAIKTLASSANALVKKHYRKGLIGLLTISWFPQDTEVFKALHRYGEVLVRIAEARDPSDVANIIEQTASTSSSWERKRVESLIGLGAIFGINSGVELTGGKTAGLLGVALPIGIQMATPICKKSSVELMVQIFDLGAISSARLFGDSAVEAGARVRISSVTAPGILVNLGLGDSPFVLGIGMNYAPGLREMQNGDALNAVRINVNFGVDVPLLYY